MNNKIADIYDDMTNITNIQKNLLAKYHQVISDNTIDLNEKWNFFVTFPKQYKANQNHNFIPQSIKQNFPDFDWYKDLGYLHNVTINTVCFVQMLENVVKNINELTGYMNNDFYNFYRQNPKALNKLKEDILQHNLYSFVYVKEN